METRETSNIAYMNQTVTLRKLRRTMSTLDGNQDPRYFLQNFIVKSQLNAIHSWGAFERREKMTRLQFLGTNHSM
jgi:hypothetical protein